MSLQTSSVDNHIAFLIDHSPDQDSFGIFVMRFGIGADFGICARMGYLHELA
jgi:hypothetical protein